MALTLISAAYTIFIPQAHSQKIKPGIQSDKAVSDELSDVTTKSPNLSENFSTLLLAGTISSYETGKVYTRADGLIDDIYVEVGDKVKAGQALASLLPHGVEGEAQAMIAEKLAMRDKAKIDYETALKLAQVSQNSTKINVDTTKVREEANVALSQQNIETVKTTLENTKKLLEQTLKLKEAKISEAQNDVNQLITQAVISTNDVFQLVKNIITQNISTNGDGSISINDLSNVFGAKDSNTRSSFIASFNVAVSEKARFESFAKDSPEVEVTDYLALVDDLLQKTEAMLNASVTNTAGMNVEEDLMEIHEAQEDLAMAKEKLTAAVAGKNVVIYEQENMIIELENTIKEQEAMLNISEEELKLAQSELGLNSGLVENEKAEKSIEKDADVAKMEAELKVAEAALALELIRSGHNVISAPYDGVIAQKLITVGDTVMNDGPAFEIVGINSFLAKSKPAVVKFGAPENLFELINEGDDVEVVIPGKESQIYKAIITGKSSLIDPASRVFTLVASFKDDAFKEGFPFADNANVRVRVVTEKDPAWQVPSRAVKRIDGNNYLWIVDEVNQPKKIQIELLAEDGEFADVRAEGLTADSKIIIDPPDSFLNTTTGNKPDETVPLSHSNH